MPRRRNWPLYLAIAACAATTVLWILTWWHGGWWVTRSVAIQLYEGRIGVADIRGIAPPVEQQMLFMHRKTPEVHWWFHWEFGRSGPPPQFIAPLWVLPASLLLVIANALRRRAIVRCRAQHGRCLHCGYDRAGLAPDAACPECGPVASKAT